MHMKNITPKYFQKNVNMQTMKTMKTENCIDKELKSESDNDSDSDANNEEYIQEKINLIVITNNFFNTIKPNSIC